MNVFTFTGRLGSDSEVRSTPSGTAICSFSVAFESGFGDKKKTTWIRCGLFGKRAEGKLPGYLLKGTQVAISGEQYMDEWVDQSGATQKMLKLNVDKLDLISGQPSQDQAPAQQAGHQQQPNQSQQQYQQTPQPQGADDFDDSIPF